MAIERYNEEFEMTTVNQVTEGSYSIEGVSKRLGIAT